MNNNTEQKLASKNINPTAMRLLVLDSLLQQHSAVGRLVFSHGCSVYYSAIACLPS